MAGLPEGWAEFNDEAGEKYYHHAGLGLTQWERPAAPAARPVRFLGPRPRPPFHGPSPAALPLPLAVSQRGSEWWPAAALGGRGAGRGSPRLARLLRGRCTDGSRGAAGGGHGAGAPGEAW